MKSKIQGAVLLCEYCHQPFSTEQLATSVTVPAKPEFLLCLVCQRHGCALVPVTCADCGCVFPRLRKIVERRRRWCTRAFCSACHALRMAPKTVRVICSDCGRGYWRTHRAEEQSTYRGYQRRICPICQPAKMVMATCSRCRKQFPRQQKLVRAKQRMGHRQAVCPRCQRKSQQPKHQKKGERA